MPNNNQGPGAQAYRDEIGRALMTLNLNVSNLARLGGAGSHVAYTMSVGSDGAPWISLQFS